MTAKITAIFKIKVAALRHGSFDLVTRHASVGAQPLTLALEPV